jgi:diadenylate cyclase
VTHLSKNKIGAIIVLEQETGLNEYIETGTKLDSMVSSELLSNIFIPNTPLHDGAVIIRRNRISAAGCFLPLTQSQSLSKELGTRHRAAIGITELSDSLVIIVSEETGVISFARMGRLSRYLDTKSLKEIIMNSYSIKEIEQPIWTKWGARNE